MGINRTTLYDWIKRFPDFANAVKKGKAPVPRVVENALFKRCTGYTWEEVTQEIYELPGGKIEKHTKKVTRHVPPDTAAIIFYLKNKLPNIYKDKREYTDTSAIQRLDSILDEVKASASK